MYAFDYRRPSSLAEAAALLRQDPEAKLLAGGHTLIPTLKQRLARPSVLLDIGHLAELRGLREENGGLAIGAAVRHGEVAASDLVRRTIPALAALASHIGDPAVRNRGTMGGSIANADPAADWPAAVVGCGAILRTDRREIAADDFFRGLFETALEEGEILREVWFPRPERAAYAKFPNPASRYAIVGVFVAKFADRVRVAVTGAAPAVFRATEMEEALTRDFRPEAIAGIRVPEDGLNSDLHASAEYRSHLVTVMARRAVEQARAR